MESIDRIVKSACAFGFVGGIYFFGGSAFLSPPEKPPELRAYESHLKTIEDNVANHDQIYTLERAIDDVHNLPSAQTPGFWTAHDTYRRDFAKFEERRDCRKRTGAIMMLSSVLGAIGFMHYKVGQLAPK